MIFIDSSFWIAHLNANDQHHEEALVLYRNWRNDRLVTTNHVRGETWTFLRRRAGHRTAVGFLDSLGEATRVRVIRVPEDLEEQALAWLRRHDERVYSFVDATSFALMKELGMREVLAFDRDFSAAGFIELRI